MIIFFVLLVLVIPTWAQPTCQWQCDDPQGCLASCKAVCKPPVCSWTCPGGRPSSSCGRPPSCFVTCPDPVGNDTLEMCPTCTTKCESTKCVLAGGISCPISCEETQCSWACTKPDNCQEPTCELQCNTPACACDGVNYTCFGMKGQTLSLLTLISCMIFIVIQ